MNAARRRHILLALILAGILLLSCLIPYTLIKLGVFGAKKDAVPQALSDYGELSPVLLGGEVCFPVRSADGALAYVPASEAQDAGGAAFLLTASGEAALPDDFLMRAKADFGTVAYASKPFTQADQTSLLLARGNDGSTAVVGAVFRRSERFFLGSWECELDDELLSDIASAIVSLGGN